MSFSIKNTLPLWILFFTCSFLRGTETVEEHVYPKYYFYENKDCIKVKIVLPVDVEATSILSKGVAVQIKNDKLKSLETFYQLADIKVHAIPSQEKEGVKFEIIETLERKPANKDVLEDRLTRCTEYFVKTNKQVDFKDDLPPKFTVSPDSPHIKYLRFFTKLCPN